MQSIVRLGSLTSVKPSSETFDGWIVVEGAPTMKTWVLHISQDSQMMSGYWEATPGTYHATYSAYEFVHVIEGKMTITPDGGVPVHIKAGDAFVVEADFKGLWKIEETIRKHFDFKL